MPADRQVAAVPQTAVAAEIHQALDVHGHFAPQIALDLQLKAVDRFADLAGLVVVEIIAALVERHASGGQDLTSLVPAHPIEVGQRNFHTLVAGKVDTGNASHLFWISLIRTESA
jgi:hypothetical protein